MRALRGLFAHCACAAWSRRALAFEQRRNFAGTLQSRLTFRPWVFSSVQCVFQIGDRRPRLDQETRTQQCKRVAFPKIRIGEIERLSKDFKERRRAPLFPIGIARRAA
jgi:hypothetical protein